MKNTFLRVIPTVTVYFVIASDILSGSMCGWHIFPVILAFVLAFFLAVYLAYILTWALPGPSHEGTASDVEVPLRSGHN